MKVSVILPTRNNSECLPLTLLALKQQIVKIHQIVIVDDDSDQVYARENRSLAI